ncbi:hypothetical protein BN14_09057 [Rhizoctonia solani AG-1 IB]|uniref:Uncharacterized protein n=1 Tax=Thanatephorus cucumeris (strain AG1-IB / isolate 7/3/14) TaxID=1108050 RepID=M5C6A7_THACB|nr:hypothetical protein BN14_09057 [Rhizoctonia solani AG-1 IB]
MTTAPETIFYPTYNPPYSPHQIGADVSAYGHTGAVVHKEFVDTESERASTSNASVARGPWWMLGFEKRLSLAFFILFAGAAIGFSLAGLEKMNFRTLIKTTTPAEGYWYQKLPWKTFIMLHILTTIR